MRILRSCAGLLALGALVACGQDSPTAPDAEFALVADEQAQGGKLLTTTLTGAAERPTPGDPDGSGVARITLNQGTGLVCWELTAENIGSDLTGAHIHIGDETIAGPVVIALSSPTGGRSTGCTTADTELVKAIRKDPSNYYVNVHNTEFPGGAIRGQL